MRHLLRLTHTHSLSLSLFLSLSHTHSLSLPLSLCLSLSHSLSLSPYTLISAPPQGCATLRFALRVGGLSEATATGEIRSQVLAESC